MIRMVIWVTSDCNLSCRFCNQGHAMRMNKGYQMSLDEVKNMVDSCKRRNIRFEVIELTGGEPSLWVNIREGVKLFKEICDDITLITNGNNPELIIELGLKSWIVSSSQATEEQLRKFDSVTDRIMFNSHEHKRLPKEAVPNSLPAICCVANSAEGIPQNSLSYIKGKVYYCCTTLALSGQAPANERTVCDFEEDFLLKYKDKDFNEDMCQYCVCNAKVWETL